MLKKILLLVLIFLAVNLFLADSAFATIALRGTATSGITANGTLSIVKPSSVVAGDVMFANISELTTTTDDPVSDGWTLVDGATFNATTYGAVLYRVADGTEGASFTFTLGTGVTSAVGSIVAFSGVNTSGTNPFDVTPGTINVSNSATVTALTITTASANAGVVMFGQARNTANWGSWTLNSLVSFSEISDFHNTGNNTVGAAAGLKATAGATGNATATLSTGTPINGGILIALKPATGSVPTITSLGSGSGCVGTSITINGTNLAGVTAANVKIGGTPVSSITSNTGTQIVAVIGSGSTGYVTVTTGAGTAISPSTFTVNIAPTITASAAPTTVCSGSNVTLTTSATPAFPTTLLSENFNSGTNNWTKTNNSTGGTPANAAWTLRANGYVYSFTTFHSNDNSQFYLSNSDAQGSGGTTATLLQSPVMNTMGFTALSLVFYQYYNDYNANDAAKVQVSINGTSWTDIATYTVDQGSESSFLQTTINLNGYINNSTFYVRFKYDAIYGFYWALDNVTISGTSTLYNFSWIGAPSGTAGLPAGAGTSAAANSSIVANPIATTAYTATAVNPGTGCSANSTPVNVTARPVFDAGAILTTGQTICYNGNPGLIGNATVASGGDGTITYQWQSSTNVGFTSPTTIASNTSTYDPPANLTIPTWYRRQAKDNTCSGGFVTSSGVWAVSVTPTVGTPSAPSGTTTLCQGSSSTAYTSSATNATSYTWSVTGAGNSVSGTGTTGTVTWAPGFSGLATVGVIANGCGTSLQATTVVTVNASGLWIGASTGDWEVDGNWCGGKPSATTDVVIPSATTVTITSLMASPAECKTLNIASSGKLIIGAGKALTVSGLLTNNAGPGGLVIESNLAEGTGSLINSSPSVNATVKRYIPAANWTTGIDGWHFLSSPVAAQPISPAFTTAGPPTNDYDFYAWYEPSNLWVNYKNTTVTPTFSFVNGGTNFNLGSGYLVAYQQAGTKQFEGPLNVSDITFTNLTITPGGANYSWHLLGNPYSSALIWDASTGTGAWNKSSIGGVADIWNGTANSYTPVNVNDVIPATNGFMVEATSATNSITIPALKRIHRNTTPTWFKKIEYPVIKLFAKNTGSNQSYQESQVRVNPASTSGFDLEYDGHFISGYAAQFYSVLGSDNLIVNSIPELLPETVIPFTFIKNEGTNFIIEAQFTALPASTTVWLLDKKTGTDQNLSDNPVYNFTSAAGDDPARFELHFFAAQWTGNQNTSWINNNNWNGGVPLSSSSITINPSANKPVISSATDDVYSLTVNAGASVTIDAGGELTVTHNLTNNAGNTGLFIKSGGSLITKGLVTGAATVERDIAGGEWHLISSPVAGAQSGIFAGKYLQTHDETSNIYTDITSTSDPLTTGKGFALFDAGGFTAQFIGTPFTGDLNIPVTKNGDGWNLVGNPYPSSIDWDATPEWIKTNVNNTTYIHVNTANWATYVGKVGLVPGVGTNGGSQFIAPEQGFFVEANSGGNLGMTNNARLHHTTPFFKGSNSTINNMIRLQLTGNGYADETVVRFLPEATTEFDGDYDARKIYGDVPEAAQLYSLGSTPLSINTLPETNVVTIGMHAGSAGDYTITATEINDLNYVTLEDTKTGTFTELALKPYTFTFTSGENEQRFKLHFSALGIDEIESSVAAIYSYQHTVYVNMYKQVKGDIYIYNVSGQLVSTKLSASGMNEIKLSNTGNYIVKVVSKDSSLVRKVFIN